MSIFEIKNKIFPGKFKIIYEVYGGNKFSEENKNTILKLISKNIEKLPILIKTLNIYNINIDLDSWNLLQIKNVNKLKFINISKNQFFYKKKNGFETINNIYIYSKDKWNLIIEVDIDKDYWYNNAIIGDINEDGSIDEYDLNLLDKNIQNIENLSIKEQVLSDINEDGSIDIDDYFVLQSKL